VSPSTEQRYANWALGAATLLFAIFLLRYHYQLITSPVPLDVFENAMPFITGLIAEGGNPYSYEHQPLYTNVYPPLYNLLAAPLTGLFGNTLLLHRSLAGAFILAVCLLCYKTLRWRSADRSNALAAAVLLYGALLYSATPVASASSTGLLFYLLCLLLPWAYQFSPASLALSGICAVLAFYGKQYFLAAPAFVCLYLFLFQSKHHAIGYALGTGALLLLSIVAMQLTSPYYFDNTVFSTRAAAAMFRQPDHMLKQMLLFLQVYAGVILALLVGLLTGMWPSLRKSWRRPDYFWFTFLLATAVIAAFLGHSRGNHMSYLFQMMSPLLVIAAFTQLSQLPRGHALAVALLMLSFWQTWKLLPADISISEENWRRIDAEIQAHQTIYSDALFLHNLQAHGKTIYQGPLTEWFYFAVLKPPWLVREDVELRVKTITDKRIQQINNMLDEQAFDLVILRRGKFGIIGAAREGFPFEPGDGQAAFRDRYQLQYELAVPLPPRGSIGKEAIQVWKPIP
jgi:4-amino-4-deoxy-L-arabinose transferase-like glycosyltransferase